MIEFEVTRRVKPHISIAPLIDCVLQLLIFFLLTSNITIYPGIKITLPKAETSKLHEEKDIIVFISERNEIYLNDRQIDINLLKEVLEGKLKTSYNKTVILKADKKINLGLAVKVMDIAKQSQAEILVISTKKEDVNK